MTDGGRTMGSAVRASKIGLTLERVCERYHARGTESTNKISVVKPANLNESMNGVKSKFCKVSIIP